MTGHLDLRILSPDKPLIARNVLNVSNFRCKVSSKHLSIVSILQAIKVYILLTCSIGNWLSVGSWRSEGPIHIELDNLMRQVYGKNYIVGSVERYSRIQGSGNSSYLNLRPHTVSSVATTNLYILCRNMYHIQFIIKSKTDCKGGYIQNGPYIT